MKLKLSLANGTNRAIVAKLTKDKIHIEPGLDGSQTGPRPEDDGKGGDLDIEIPSHSTGGINGSLENTSPSTTVTVTGGWEGDPTTTQVLAPGATMEIARSVTDAGARGRWTLAGAKEPA